MVVLAPRSTASRLLSVRSGGSTGDVCVGGGALVGNSSGGSDLTGLTLNTYLVSGPLRAGRSRPDTKKLFLVSNRRPDSRS